VFERHHQLDIRAVVAHLNAKAFGLNLAHSSRITWATNTCSVQ
jgi:hypothetical protein